MALTGRTEAEVVAAANATGSDDVVDVVAYLLDPPPNPGAKYIPPKPVIDDGLTPDVREKLKLARELSDRLNSLHKPIGAAPIEASQKSTPKTSLAELVDQQQVAQDERSAVVSLPVLPPPQMSPGTPGQTM
jgi:hypothetical protein